MTGTKTRTTPFDVAKYLTTTEAQAELLSDALESGDASYIALTLGHITRAKGVSKVAAEAKVTREALYKGLSETGDPRLSTVVGVIRALGFELRAIAKPPGPTEAARA